MKKPQFSITGFSSACCCVAPLVALSLSFLLLRVLMLPLATCYLAVGHVLGLPTELPLRPLPTNHQSQIRRQFARCNKLKFYVMEALNIALEIKTCVNRSIHFTWIAPSTGGPC